MPDRTLRKTHPVTLGIATPKWSVRCVYERFAPHVLPEQTAPAVAKPVATAKPARSFWIRFYDALLETQRQRAQREIDRKLGPGALQRAIRTTFPEDN
jgi:hypothetical protein